MIYSENKIKYNTYIVLIHDHLSYTNIITSLVLTFTALCCLQKDFKKSEKLFFSFAFQP